MKKLILTSSILFWAFTGLLAQIIYNNGALITSQSGTYWVIDYGNVTLKSESSTNPVNMANLNIKADASLTLTPNSFLTVSGTVINSSGDDGLVVKSTTAGTASLIQNTVGVTGTIERYIGGWTDAVHGWHFLSSPVTNQAISTSFVDITASPISSDVDLYRWSELENLWINIKNGAGTYNVGSGSINWSANASPEFETGTGYMTAYSTNQTKAFTGTLNVADVTLSGLSNTVGKNARGWHLVGNPFSSAIKWNQGSWEKTNIGSVPQIWNETSASYTVLSVDGIIPAHNGFLVYTTGSGSLTIPADARLHSSDAWYKNSASANEIVLLARDTKGKTAQESIISFNPDATEDFDMAHDSYFMAGFAPMFYSISQNKLFALNTLPELKSEMVVPMGFVKNQSTDFSIELTQNIAGQTLFLVDLKTNSEHKISESPYNFTSANGDNPNRFLLRFGTTGIGENTKEQPIVIYTSGTTVYISNPKGIMLKGDLFVYNTMGQTLLQQKLTGNSPNKINLNASTGYYMVKVITDGNAYRSKVFIKR
jgi:hypothetical protein